jgi:hypothetical protein
LLNLLFNHTNFGSKIVGEKPIVPVLPKHEH